MNSSTKFYNDCNYYGESTDAKIYTVKVKDNPDFCGIGAGGVQFVHGMAKITSERMAEWFREHKGYTVTEIDEQKSLAGNDTGGDAVE